MKSIKKGNRVRKICDGIKTPLSFKNFVMFEDNWVSETDKILYDKNGDSFSVLGFKEIEENVLDNPEYLPYFDGWRMCKFSCVKLDKNVNVGDILFTY